VSPSPSRGAGLRLTRDADREPGERDLRLADGNRNEHLEHRESTPALTGEFTWELLHKVLVFDSDKQVAAVSSCRKPRWTGPTDPVCSSESAGSDGRIKLKPKKVSVGH